MPIVTDHKIYSYSIDSIGSLLSACLFLTDDVTSQPARTVCVHNCLLLFSFTTYSNHPALRKQAESRGSGFLTRQQHPASFLTCGAGFLTSVGAQR